MGTRCGGLSPSCTPQHQPFVCFSLSVKFSEHLGTGVEAELLPVAVSLPSAELPLGGTLGASSALSVAGSREQLVLAGTGAAAGDSLAVAGAGCLLP